MSQAGSNAGLLLLALGALLTFVPAALEAQSPVVRREYAIKAGVLGLLGKCVSWPDQTELSRGQPLIIGVLGPDPFFENGANQLDQKMAEEKSKGAAIVVKRFATIEEYQPCHILFVSNLPDSTSDQSMFDEQLAAALRVTRGQSVLVVGETSGLAQRGAAANLLFDRATNLIRLEINPDAAARAGLKLAPDLLRLKLVQIVRDVQ
jgi:hypothetical protein